MAGAAVSPEHRDLFDTVKAAVSNRDWPDEKIVETLQKHNYDPQLVAHELDNLLEGAFGWAQCSMAAPATGTTHKLTTCACRG